MQCPSCGNQNDAGAMFCDNCGATLGGGAGGAAPVAPIGVPQAPFESAAGASSGAGMNCPQCGTSNLPGTLFCDSCGASLSGAAAGPGGGVSYPPPMPPGTPSGAQPPFPARMMIGSQTVQVPQKSEIIVGRADIASGWNPDLDLTPYGGTPEAGVSRKHAKLVWQGTNWAIEDLNSVNHTYLRGVLLTPYQRTPLSGGETIQLGKLQFTFYPQ